MKRTADVKVSIKIDVAQCLAVLLAIIHLLL